MSVITTNITMTCKACNTELANEGEALGWDSTKGCVDMTCPTCKADAGYVVENKTDHPVFHFATQMFYSPEGECLGDKYEGDFPCQFCAGPAKFTSFSSYYEHYTCRCCGKETKVN